MSSPSTRPTRQPPDDLHDLSVQVATWATQHKGLEEDVQTLDRRMGNLETEVRNGFSTLGHDLRRMTQPKGIAWQMVSVFLVAALALGTWARDYFSQGIQASMRETSLVHEREKALEADLRTLQQQIREDGKKAAYNEGFQTATQKALEKEHDDLRRDIDRMGGPAKLAQ